MRLFARSCQLELHRKTEGLLLELHRSNHIRIGSMPELDAYECALHPDLCLAQERSTSWVCRLLNRDAIQDVLDWLRIGSTVALPAADH